MRSNALKISEEQQDRTQEILKHPRKRLRGNSRVSAVFLGLLLALCACAYIVTAVYFSGHFYPSTTINGVDFSGADPVAVSAAMMTLRQDSVLRVLGRDNATMEKRELFTVTAQDVDLIFSVAEADIRNLLKGQKSWLWPVYMSGNHAYMLEGGAEFDEGKLEAFLAGQEAFREENMTAPADAYIEGYSETEQRFVLVPEVYGTQADRAAVQKCIGEAMRQGQEQVDLEEQGCYEEPAVTVADPDLQQSIAKAEKWLETRLVYDWNGSEVVLDRERIQNWVVLRNGRLALDETAVAEFVAENAGEHDTYGKNRIFHTTLGYDLDLPGGAFGWLTDREAEVLALIELIEAGTIGEREPKYASKGPWKGINDIGNTYVEADMTHQHLYLYQKGEIVLETDFVSGDMNNGNRTPEGVFGLTYKTMNAVLRGRDYVTPVTYWMPFNGNVGMHDATWRDTFGGDIYLHDGSHGCLNLPLDKAEEIYQYMTEGFPIICYYYPPGVLPEAEPETPDDDDD